jgi:hypothetical protein
LTMTITVTYHCDRCETDQPTSEQFWEVAVALSSVQTPHTGAHKRITQHWCRKCVEDFHLLPPIEHNKAAEELPPAPTLEDLVREIAREEITELTGAA